MIDIKIRDVELKLTEKEAWNLYGSLNKFFKEKEMDSYKYLSDISKDNELKVDLECWRSSKSPSVNLYIK